MTNTQSDPATVFGAGGSSVRAWRWVGLHWLLIGLGFAGLGCRSTPQVMPTPNLYLGSTEAFRAVPPALRTNTVDLLYVTDRAPELTRTGGLVYGYRRSPSLAFGSCQVSLGRDVPWDVLVRDSVSRERSRRYPLLVGEISELGRFPTTPYALEPVSGSVDLQPGVAARAEYWNGELRSEVARRLALTPRKEVYVFVHGFNNDFTDAVTMAAQLWHFLEREGVMIAYTWPAGIGGLRGYGYDRESGEFTVHHLKEFLRVLLSQEGVEKVHLMAHSRGTDVLTSALRELVVEERGRQGRTTRFDRVANVILLAPDLDMEVAGQRISAEQVQAAVGRFTVYVCREDKAVTLSNWMFEGISRLGAFVPSTVSAVDERTMKRFPRLQFVGVEGKASFLSHGYFHRQPGASSDLVLLIREDCDAGTPGCRPLQPVQPGFWRLDPEYPGRGSAGFLTNELISVGDERR